MKEITIMIKMISLHVQTNFNVLEYTTQDLEKKLFKIGKNLIMFETINTNPKSTSVKGTKNYFEPY